MPHLLTVFLALLFFAVMGMIWVVREFGVWGAVGVAVGLVLAFWIIKRNISWLLERLFMAPFKMKAAVLKQAQVEVHRLQPADVPQRTEDDIDELLDEEDLDEEELEQIRGDIRSSREQVEQRDARRDWYLVELTITPQPKAPGGFQHWEPGELQLESPDADPDEIDDDDDPDGSETCEINQLWIFDPETELWEEDEGLKYHGPVKLRLHCGVPCGGGPRVLRYYFELFGEIAFPVEVVKGRR